MDRSISLPLSLSLFCSTGLFFNFFFNVFICPQQRSPLTKQASVHQAKVSSWLQSSEGMDKCNRGQSAYVTTAVSSSTYSSFTSAPSGRCELKISSFSSISLLKDLDECESYLLELNLLLKSMEVLHRTYSAPAISALQVSTQRERDDDPSTLHQTHLSFSLHCITCKSSNVVVLYSFSCTTGLQLRAPQEGEETEEVEIQK